MFGELPNTLKKIGTVLEYALMLPFAAFSYRTRREIGERDRWTCQVCGRNFYNGWMVDASHFDHSRSNPYYDTSDNGQIECLGCHVTGHINNYLDAPNDPARYAVMGLFSSRIMREGFHTWKHYEAHPEALEADRMEYVRMLDKEGLDIWDFVDPEKFEPRE